MKLVPATFPLSNVPLPSARADRARLRQTGPIRITLRAAEATSRIGMAPPRDPGTSATPKRLSIASPSSAKKKASRSSDVLLMLL